MTRGRLEAFSDGVIAIIITIMVLEMKVPHGDRLEDLVPLVPTFLSYVLSFIYVGIYWNNHHHMLHAATAVTGAMMWANLYLLFWLSLFRLRHRMDGAEPFHRCAYRTLWGGVVDGCDRLPPFFSRESSAPKGTIQFSRRQLGAIGRESYQQCCMSWRSLQRHVQPGSLRRSLCWLR